MPASFISMDPKQLSTMLVNMIKASPLTEEQRQQVAIEVSTAIFSVGTTVSTAPKEQPKVIEVPQELPPGNVIIPKGRICVCELCKKAVFQVVSDVTETMKIAAFIAAFEPAPGLPSMSKDNDIWGDPYGNLAVDCPACKGRKTVWIKGKGDKAYADYADQDNLTVDRPLE